MIFGGVVSAPEIHAVERTNSREQSQCNFIRLETSTSCLAYQGNLPHAHFIICCMCAWRTVIGTARLGYGILAVMDIFCALLPVLLHDHTSCEVKAMPDTLDVLPFAS